MQLQYLTNIAATLNEAIVDLTADNGAAPMVVINRWIGDFQSEMEMIVNYEIPAEKCYDC